MKLATQIITGNELLSRLRAADWKKIILNLHYYALNKLERYPILEGRYNVNDLANQFADEAIRMVYDEERKWNRDAYQELYPFLTGIVDSIVSNFLKSSEFLLSERLPEDDYDLTDSSDGGPENDLIVQEMIAQIKEILASDVEAFQVFECLKDGLKPREIAPELNIEISEVRNIIKRVYRKLHDYKVKLKAG